MKSQLLVQNFLSIFNRCSSLYNSSKIELDSDDGFEYEYDMNMRKKNIYHKTARNIGKYNRFNEGDTICLFVLAVASNFAVSNPAATATSAF